MTTATAFDTSADLIIVEALAWGPHGKVQVRLAVDTGAAATTLVPEVMDEIGLSARDGRSRTTVTTAIGQERGYTLRLPRIEALGVVEDNFVVHVFDLESREGIQGMLGLNFLNRLNYEVRSIEGRILAERATP